MATSRTNWQQQQQQQPARLLQLLHVALLLIRASTAVDALSPPNECACLTKPSAQASSELVCQNWSPGASYPAADGDPRTVQIAGTAFRCRGYELSAPGFGIEAIEGELGRGLAIGQRIYKVDLSSNRLSVLDQPHFAALPNLRRLQLAGNRLRFITYRLFDKVAQLHFLDLDDNGLTEVTQQTFGSKRVFSPGDRCNLRSLVYLYLANNHIERVDPSSFECMSSLQVLNLQKNLIKVLPNDAFAGLTAIRSVKIYGNQLYSVADSAFDQCCTQLRVLNLVDNKLSHLSRNIFNSMGNLTSLYMDRNQFVQIPTYLLARVNGKGPASLIDFHMQRNHIVQIRANDFKDAGKIESLNLFDNSIQRIEDYSFAGLSWTKNLVLQKNELLSVTNRTLAGLTNLQYLVLVDNHIEYLEDYAFATLPRLDTLSLSSNRITEIRRLMFSGLNNTFALNLASNYIQSLRGDEFELMPSLRYLYLEKNHLTRLRPSYFRGLSGLRKLDLSDNRIYAIEPLAFRDLGQLAFLDLSGNALTSACFSAFFGLSGLQSLFLGKNQIAALDPNLIARLQTLSMLDLRDNRLAEFAAGWAADENLGASALSYLDLSGNSLQPDECTFCGLDSVRYAHIGVMPRNATHLTVASLRGLGRWSDLELTVNGHRVPASRLDLGGSASWQVGACDPDDVAVCRSRHANLLKELKVRACRLPEGGSYGRSGSGGSGGGDSGSFVRLMLYVSLPVVLLLVLAIGSVSAFYLVAKRKNSARASAGAASMSANARGGACGVGGYHHGNGGARTQVGTQGMMMMQQQQPPQQQMRHLRGGGGGVSGLTMSYDTEPSLLELNTELSPSTSDVKYGSKMYGNLLT